MTICLKTAPVFGALALAGMFLFAPQAANAMGVSFSWSKADACATKSPAFKLSGVPRGAKRLRFAMKDLNVPSYYHGGGTIAYKGLKIARGAFSYRGPCPPRGQKHTYRWTVKALDAKGKTLGSASSSRAFKR